MPFFPTDQDDRLQALIFWNKQSGGMHLNPTLVLTDIHHRRRGDFNPYKAAVQHCTSFMLLPHIMIFGRL